MDKRGRAVALIKAHDDCGHHEKDCHFLFAVHKPGTYVERAVRLAFKDWAKTDEGREFIDSNGCNWGDALEIPTRFLKANGIFRLGSLHGGRVIRALRYDFEVGVDHNENLVED